MKRQREAEKSIWYYIKNYKFRSILVRNFACVIVFATVPLLVTIYRNYINFSQEMNLRMEENNKDLLLKSTAVIDNILKDILAITENMPYLPECRYLYEQDSTDARYKIYAEQMMENIREYERHYSYVKSIYLYSSLNQLVLDSRGLFPVKEFSDRGKWYDIYKRFPMYCPYTLTGDDAEIMFGVPLFGENQDLAGLIVVNVDMKTLGNLLEWEEVSSARNFFILDINGQIMYCNNGNYLSETQLQFYEHMIGDARKQEGSMIEKKNSNVVTVSNSSYESWEYALVTELPLYTEEMTKLRSFLIGSVITGILPGLFAAYLITLITYQPVKKILQVIDQPKENHSEQTISNEVLYITSNILNTIDKKEKMQDELEKRIQSLRIAQSLALQFQVDPHFLYNTLDIIKWISVEDMGKGNRTSKLLSKVARLYRIALESDNMVLTLRREIEFLKLYIDVLDIRYSGKIHYEWQVDESLYDCQIIKLCIQPVVENAVKHGLKPRMYEGSIWIRAERKDHKLNITVENDGEEMTVSEIAAMNATLKKRNGFPNAKVGLLNINERIKLLYGLDYGVEIGRREGGFRGMKVVLTFPLHFL